MCHGQNLRKFVDELTSNEGVDITLYLELEFQFVQGLLCIKGPYEMLRRFIDVMIKTGMEKCLAFTGWMTACHFTSVVDPVVAEIVFFRKPSTPAVSLDLVQAFIHSALVTLAMPRLKAASRQSEIVGRLHFSGSIAKEFTYPRHSRHMGSSCHHHKL